MPYDIVDREVPTCCQPPKVAPQSDAGTLAAAVAETADMLRAAKKPVILAGVELHRYGVTDLAMGVVADRTETRWGKFRPWILWTAVPFGILGVLTFTAPGFGPAGRLAWAYATYSALIVLYTMNNVPYNSHMLTKGLQFLCMVWCLFEAFVHKRL